MAPTAGVASLPTTSRLKMSAKSLTPSLVTSSAPRSPIERRDRRITIIASLGTLRPGCRRNHRHDRHARLALRSRPVLLPRSPCWCASVDAAGGVMITASHNPYRWNGIKFKASYGSSPLPSIVAQIEEELAAVLSGGIPPLPPRPEQIHSLDILGPYLDTIEKLVDWEKMRAAEPALRCRSHARRGSRAVVFADAPPGRRLRRDPRHARSALRRRQSRAHRASRRGVA